jgi:plastocyanin
MLPRPLRALLPVLALAVLTAACAADAAGAPAEPPVAGDAVTLRDNAFTPALLAVTPGTTVTWIWDDGSTQHNVVFDDAASDIQSEGTWTHTFTDPGTYDYVCALHGGMRGSVVVGPAG